MQDRLTVGVLAGMTAQVIKFPLGFSSVALGLAKYADVHVAGGIFLTPAQVVTPLGIAIGFVGTLGIAAMWGVLFVYILSGTGKDFWLIKGLGFGLIAWVLGWGIFENLGFSRVIPVDYGSNIVALILYLIWGLLTSYLMVRWADDDLFTGANKLR